MKKTFCLCLFALVIVLCACAPKESDPAVTPTSEPEEIIICKINDAVITRSDFVSIFDMYYQYYSQYYEFSESDIKELQNDIFDSLVRAEIIYQQAVKEGITLTAEQEAEINKSVDENFAALAEQAKTLAEQEGAADIENRALEILSENLAKSGTTEQEYKDKSFNEQRKSYLMNTLYEKTTASITHTYTEQQASSDFAGELENARKEYTDNPALYETALTNYESSGGIPPLFIPEGYVRVKHILVDTKEESNELHKRLIEGEDFDALMAEYGTDPGMKSEPNKSQGYLMGPGTAFDRRFKDAGFALENVGDISEPFESSYNYGWHIVKLVEIVESHAYSFDEIKDEYMGAKLLAMKEKYFSDELAKWTEEADITSYIGRIRDLGKTS